MMTRATLLDDVGVTVRRAQCGDTAAVSSLVRQFAAMTIGYAYSMVHDLHLAEDIAQESMFHAHQHLAQLHEPAAFPGWLRRIVFKHADRVRRSRRRVAEIGDTFVDCGADPTQQAQRAETARQVQAAIGRLPAAERAVVAMFYLGEHSHSGIAKFLGVRVNTVKSRLHTARAKLKGRLMTMVEDTLQKHVPDDSFARRVQAAIEVLTCKGPEHDSTKSPWEQRRREQIRQILGDRAEGFDVTIAMSRSTRPKARCWAAIQLGLWRDDRSRDPRLRLMHDENVRVRVSALRSYAMLLHDEARDFFDIGRPASRVPQGLEPIIERIKDNDETVRVAAIKCLGAYAKLGEALIESGLRRGLEDPVHKVRHEAARALAIACPGCGTLPKGHRVRESN